MGKLTNRLLNSAMAWSSTVPMAPPASAAMAHGYFALEPRVMFDAAGIETALHVVDDVSDISPEVESATDDLLAALQVSDEEVAAALDEVEIVFVDSGVEDIDVIIAGFGPDVEVHVLEAGSDGVGQIADVLQGRTGIDAIHIISHGRSGTLDLGSTKLTEASMAGRHADELAVIRSALSDSADILLYGCDFAAGSRGQSAVAALASATGADVAASDDLTGAADLGGDWVLEESVGTIETGSLNVEGWGHSLSLNNTGNWTVAGTTATNVTAGVTTTIAFTPTAGGSVTALSGAQTLNPTTTPASFFVNSADSYPSLGFTYTWDTTPEAATGVPQPQAGVDDAPMTVTITFSTAVTNPVINIDRLGGNGTYDPNTAVTGDENSISNSSSWQITTPGATLTKLSGVAHLDVTSTTFQRTPNVVMATTGVSGEASTNALNSTAAGSIRVNGTFTTLTFVVTGIGVEGAGADGIEIGVTVDPPPNANNDAFTVAEDTTLTGNLYANNGSGVDVDANADTMTITQVNGAAFTVGSPIALTNGTFTITNATTGAFTFLPNANYVGGQPFNYTIADANGGTDTATASITVTAVNDAPVDGNETNTVTEDTTLTVADGAAGDLLNNATDVEGNPLTITGYTIAGVAGTQAVGTPVPISGVGNITINANGSYSFAPAANYTGAIPAFTYTVSDGAGGTDTSTLTLSMTAVNDAPVDGNETNTATEDTTLTVADGAAGDLLNNATDVEGNTLSITGYTIAGVAGTQAVGTPVAISGVGTITINANGSYSFAPAANYTGAIPVFTYTVSDGVGGTDTSTLTLSMTAVNDAPVDGDETNTVVEDTTLTVADGAAGDLLNNATDVEGNALTISGYTISGVAGTQAVGAPVVIAGVGTIVINANGSYSFAPAANYTGAIPVFTYTVSDGAGGTDTSTLTLSITAVNDAPVDGNETNTVLEDTTLTVADGAAGDLLNNATDVDGNALSISGYTIAGIAGTQAVGSPVVISGVGTITINANGSYSFAPVANYTGAIPVMTYTVSDGVGGTDTSTLTLSITAVNDAPVDADETNTVTEDTTLTVVDGGVGDLLNNATDVEGNALTISGYTIGGVAGTQVVGTPVVIPGVGTITINGNGSYSFAPAANYTGAIPVITYTVSDGAGGTDTSTLALSMTAVNDAPLDSDETNTVTEDTPLVVPAATGLLANATDVDGNPLTVSAFTVAGVAGTPVVGTPFTIPGVGSLTVNANGGYTFTPAPNYTGPIPVITYTVSDGQGGTDTSTLTLAITSVNDAPVAVNDGPITAAAGTPVDVVPLQNDSDTEGGPIRVTGLIDPANPGTPIALVVGTPVTLASGTIVELLPNGTLNVTLGQGVNPTEMFTYIISDPEGLTDTAMITLARDTDGDGLSNGEDLDDDNDGVLDTVEDSLGLDMADFSTWVDNATTGFVNYPSGGTVTINVAQSYTPGSYISEPGYPNPGSGVEIVDFSQDPNFVSAFPGGLIGQASTLAFRTDTNAIGTIEHEMTFDYTTTDKGFADGNALLGLGGVYPDVPGSYDSQIKITATKSDGTPETDFTGWTVVYPSPGFVSTGTTGFSYSVGIESVTATPGGLLIDPNNLAFYDFNNDTVPFFVRPPEGSAYTSITVNRQLTTFNSGLPGAVPTDHDNFRLYVAEAQMRDSDGDGVTNSLDLDSDNDGISDLTESGQDTASVDSNNDGVHDGASNASGIPVAANGGAGVAPIDSDGDGVDNYVDLDSDNDGIADTVEVRPTAGYVANDGDVTNDDSDGDGVIDIFDTNAGFGATFAAPENTDGDATNDYLDTDSDNDGKLDIVESGLTPGSDLNGDGIGDGVGASYGDPDGVVNDPTVALANEVGGTGEVAYREVDKIPLIDLNSVATDTDTDRNNTVIYTENGAPVAVAALTADVNDRADQDLTALDISLSGIVDGVAEIITIAGVNFPLAASLTQLVTVGGTTFQIAYTAGAGFAVQKSGGGTMDQADLDLLIRGITYNHTSDNPTIGNRTLTFSVTDGAGNVSPNAVATINVTAVNDPPIADDDAFTTNEDTVSLPIDLLAGDTDADGDTLTVQSIAGVALTPGTAQTIPVTNGTVKVSATGVVTFTPAANYNGPVTFDYVVADGNGDTDTGTVNGTIVPVNDPPVIIDPLNPGTPLNPIEAPDPLNIIPDVTTSDSLTPTPIDVSAYVADPENDTLSYAATGLPPGLVLDPVTGIISGTLTPDASQGGPNNDGIYLVTVTIDDGNGGTATTTVTYTAGNPPPVAVDDTGTVVEDTPLNVPAATGLLANDSDPDGDALTITDFTVPGVGTIAAGSPALIPGVGTLTINPDGSYDFTPTPNYAGPVPLVTYTVSDGEGGTDTATLQLTVTPVNDAPVIIDPLNPGTPLNPIEAPDPLNIIPDVTTSDSLTPPSIDVSDYVVDPEGDTLTYSATGLPLGLTLDPATGIINGTLTADASQGGPNSDGIYPVTITIIDGNGGTATTTVTYTIGNPPPEATNDTGTVIEDTTLTVLAVTGLLANDSDPDGDALTITAFNVPGVDTVAAGSTAVIPNIGTLTINPDGSYEFVPETDYVGPIPVVTYTVSDGEGGTDTATLALSITPVNDLPVAQDDDLTTTENAPLTTSVFADNGNGVDSDIDGDTISVSEVNGVAGDVGQPVAGSNGGDFTINPDGTLTFNPGTDFDDLAVGEDRTTTVTYTISDGNGGTDTATVTVTVTGTNDSPVSTPIAPQSNDDADPVTLDLSGNFSDPDATDVLAFSATNLPTGLVIDPVTGIISGTIDNSASVTGPYSVTITATDPSGATTSQTFTWTIDNPPPVAQDDAVASDEDNPVSGDLFADNGSGMDSDPDGDTITVSEVNGQPANVGQPVAGSTGGTFTVNPDGTLTFDPGSDFNNLPVGVTATTTITYQISDGEGGTDTATVTVTVTGINDAPVSTPIAPQSDDDAEIIAFDVSGNFSDPDGDALAFSAIDLPPGLFIDPVTGIISGTIDNSASVTGPYAVTVTAIDPSGATTSQTFVWTVENPTPEATNDTGNVIEDTTLTVPAATGLLANDSDPDGDALTITEFNVPGVGTVAAGSPAVIPNVGTLTINPDGSYEFVPLPNYAGSIPAVTYTVSDGEGGTDTATLALSISPVNDPPVIIDPLNPGTPLNPIEAADPDNIIPDVVTNDSLTPAPIDVSDYVVDPEGDDLTYGAAGLPPGLSIDPDTGLITGTLTHDASQGGPNDDGIYPVTITIDDGNGGVATTTITYTIGNPPPAAVDDVGTVVEDTPLTVPTASGLLANDNDPDSDPLTITSYAVPGVGTVAAGSPAVIPGVGTLTINPDGSYNFSPLPNYVGPVPVATYTVSDGEGGTDTGTLRLAITPANDPPVIIDPANPGTPANPIEAPDPDNIIPDVTTNDSATPSPIDVSQYVVDPEGNTLTFLATGLPPGLSINSETGIISGTLTSGASQGGPDGDGVYPVTVTISDSIGGTTTTTITYSISNPPPVAANDTGAINEDTPAKGNVLSNDDDPDGDPLTISEVSGGNVGEPIGLPYGTLVLNADGTYSFTPNDNANALPTGKVVTQQVTYTVSDGNGGFDTATLTLTITGTNDAPVAAELPDRLNLEGDDVEIDVSDAFTDPDGDPLTFTATGLPSGLSIDPVTGVISGEIDEGAADGGPYSVIITADDGKGGTISVTFTYAVDKIPTGVVDPPPPDPVLPPYEFPPLPDVELAISPAAGGLSGLNSSPDLGDGTNAISRIVDWLGRQGLKSSWMNDIFDPLKVHPYGGDAMALGLALGEEQFFAVRTLIHKGSVHVGIDRMAGGAEILAITAPNGGGLPDFVATTGQADLVINQTPDNRWIDLEIKARTDDGRVLTWSVSIHPQSGEVVQGRGMMEDQTGANSSPRLGLAHSAAIFEQQKQRDTEALWRALSG